MNLYKIEMKHYAPRGSEYGILCYLGAENDEQVYEWLKLDTNIIGEHYIITCYQEKELEYAEEYEDADESFKEKMIRLKGDMNDDDKDLEDLFDGRTFYGWTLVNGWMDTDDFVKMQKLGIDIRFT